MSEEEKPGFFENEVGLIENPKQILRGDGSPILGEKLIDDELLEEIETLLLTADVGVEATTEIIADLTRKVARKELANSGALYAHLQEQLTGLLKAVEAPLEIDPQQPFVILMVGVTVPVRPQPSASSRNSLSQVSQSFWLLAILTEQQRSSNLRSGVNEMMCQ